MLFAISWRKHTNPPLTIMGRLCCHCRSFPKHFDVTTVDLRGLRADPQRLSHGTSVLC